MHRIPLIRPAMIVVSLTLATLILIGCASAPPVLTQAPSPSSTSAPAPVTPAVSLSTLTPAPLVEDTPTPAVSVEPTQLSEVGDPEAQKMGQDIFTGKGGCFGCHTIEGVAEGLVGPDLTHVGTNAETRNPPQTAREYITQSIREPESFVAAGVPRAVPGIMSRAFTASLSDDEVAALTEFLLAQR